MSNTDRGTCADDTERENLDDVAESAAQEWDYRTVEGQFGQEFDTSIPCQLRFTDEPQLDIQRFHEALEIHNYSPMHPDAKPDKPYYESEICSKDHYNRVRVWVGRKNVVRLFPHDDHVPDTEELARILHAITIGFKAGLEHDPIEHDRTLQPETERGGE